MTSPWRSRGGGPPVGHDVALTLDRAVAAFQAGDLPRARSLCRLVLADQKKQFDALHLLGLVELRQGRPEEALRLIKKALKVNPRSAAAHLNHGLLLSQIEGPAAAMPSFDRALAINPNDAVGLNNRGHALWLLKRPEEALASLDRALAIAPDHADALCNRGNVLCELKRFEEAIASFDRALAVDPRDAVAWHNRGNALSALTRLDEALASYDRSLAHRPDDVPVLLDRARALNRLERFDDALPTFDKVLDLAPDNVGALSGRGNALWRLKRLEEALASFDKVLAMRPDDPEFHVNRGNALAELGRHDEAMASFDRALALQPDFANGYWNRSMSRLRVGDYAGGWSDYEWRWKRQESASELREHPQPRWRAGNPLEDKTILLYPEQGLGDVIQFARFASLVGARGAKVILQVHEPLTALLWGLAGVARVIGLNEPPPPFDYHCPLLSLPLELETETIPASVPYVLPPQDRVAKWSNRLQNSETKRIAIAWAGRPTFSDDRNRSIGLPRISPLFSVPGLAFFSIQKVLRDGDDEILRRYPHVRHLGHEIEDFGDTAAIMSLMDLVVSSDTAVVHLAGALGLPVWILLQHCADWRWLRDREDSPWYPSARLFRQPAVGDWSSVVGKVADELARRGAASASPEPRPLGRPPGVPELRGM